MTEIYVAEISTHMPAIKWKQDTGALTLWKMLGKFGDIM
jgi:hypothetical protein